MPPLKCAILASGRGSNASNLMQFSLTRACHIKICCVISDSPNAKVLSHAAKFSIPGHLIPFKDKPTHEQQILSCLESYNIEWVFMAGYMRILSGKFLKHFWNPEKKIYQVVNIHPSLLPAFPGKDAYRKTWEAKERAGATVHFVTEKVDRGRFLCQDSFEYQDIENFQDFVSRGLELEHRLYIQAVEKIIAGDY